MEVQTNLVLTGDDLKIVNLIAETFMRGSQPTKTGRGKRLYFSYFTTDGEQQLASNIVSKCKHYFTQGLPQKLVLTLDEVAIYKKLEKYCLEVS